MTSPSFIALYGSYLSIELALFHKDKYITLKQEPDKRASSILIPMIDELLQSQNLTLQNLDFLAIDAGPGAFTSLRVTISTANGIAFASKIPLIGIDGLEALAHETIKQKKLDEGDTIICMLNAYNQEVYVAEFQTLNNELCKNEKPFYAPIKTVLETITKKYQTQPLYFTGNGAHLHAGLIQTIIPHSQIAPIAYASAETVGELGRKAFLQNQGLSSEIQPLYLKTATFAAMT